MRVDEEFLLKPKIAKYWRDLTINEMFYCNQIKEVVNVQKDSRTSEEALKPSARRRLYSEERAEY
jgi:hypothetical protein